MKLVSMARMTTLVALGTALMGGIASAQTPYPHPHGINQRLRDQNARIEQGNDSGQLTRREDRHLDRRDDRVQRQERRDRRTDNGHLTADERRHLNGELNRDSHAIYQGKHNDRVR